MNHTVTHDGDKRLARHVTNAVLKADSRGTRIVKEHKDSTAADRPRGAGVHGARPGPPPRQRAEAHNLRARRVTVTPGDGSVCPVLQCIANSDIRRADTKRVTVP